MNNLKKTWGLDDGIQLEGLMYLSPILLLILFDIRWYCYEHDIPFTVTSLVRAPDDGISSSDTHQTGRAVDISIKGWDIDEVTDVVSVFNNKYRGYGTAPYGKPTQVMVPHDSGHGPHIHVQVRRM